MNEKILVVDDEKELADLLEVYLKNDGYTVYILSLSKGKTDRQPHAGLPAGFYLYSLRYLAAFVNTRY